MYVYLSKILPLFVMPVSLSLILAVAALVFLLRGMKRTATAVLAAGIALLWLASTPLVAVTLYGKLEAHYPPQPLSEVPTAGCIVLLGGAVGAAVAPRVDIELTEAIDRVYKSAQLFRAGKGKYLVVTAGNQPWLQSPWVEADLIRDLLVEWGVPEAAIFLEGSSRNTRENAVYTKILVDSIHCETSLLVTSAAHMPRALAAFRSVGIRVTPVSTDVRVVGSGLPSLLDLLPNAGALAMTSDALREWLGRWVYAWQGWD